LKAGVISGVLVKQKQSFLVAGDPIYEDVREKVGVEIKSEGDTSTIVESGDTCTISYEGKLLDGHVFDSGKSFTFTVGVGDVIKGMDEGVLGMGIGERRILTIPSSLGYGKKGSSPDIPPESVLVFDIKLISIS
jgi:FKBP-type peptidyl-prolyl cis-trans isomerase